MRLTVIGNGGIVPTKNTSPSGFLLEVGGKRLLLDCGHGVVRGLVDKGIDLNTIDAVFISHFHTDHFADALPLIHTRWVADERKRRPARPCIFIGPKSLQARFKLARKIFWPEPKEHYPLTFKEGTLRFKIGKIQIETFPIEHVPWFKSIGARISCNKQTIVYTGDLSSSHDPKDLIKRIKDADLLIIEGTHETGEMYTHFSVEQIEKIASQARVKRVLIVHTIPNERPRIKKRITKRPGLILAELGMQLHI